MTYLSSFLEGINGLIIHPNKHSRETEQKRYDFLKAYPCLLQDEAYVSFLKEYNGLSAGVRDQFLFILYGFALPEPEVIFAIHQYQMNDGFIKIGEYVSKLNVKYWPGICYFYHPEQGTKVFARFTSKEKGDSDFRLLCEGFDELIKIVVGKSYVEQYELSSQAN